MDTLFLLTSFHSVFHVTGAEDASCVGNEAMDRRGGGIGGGVPGTGTACNHHINCPQQ